MHGIPIDEIFSYPPRLKLSIALTAFRPWWTPGDIDRSFRGPRRPDGSTSRTAIRSFSSPDRPSVLAGARPTRGRPGSGEGRAGPGRDRDHSPTRAGASRMTSSERYMPDRRSRSTTGRAAGIDPSCLARRTSPWVPMTGIQSERAHRHAPQSSEGVREAGPAADRSFRRVGRGGEAHRIPPASRWASLRSTHPTCFRTPLQGRPRNQPRQGQGGRFAEPEVPGGDRGRDHRTRDDRQPVARSRARTVGSPIPRPRISSITADIIDPRPQDLQEILSHQEHQRRRVDESPCEHRRPPP